MVTRMDNRMTNNPSQETVDSAYLRALAGMTPESRLRRALELSEFTRELFRQGLRSRFPALSGEAFERLYLERLELCHNRNY